MNSRSTLKKLALGLLIGYAVQFLAGMALNLFVTLPVQHPGTNGNDYFVSARHGLIWALSGSGGAALAVHAYIALVLVVGSLGLFVFSVLKKNKLWLWCSGMAAFFTIGAFFNGLSFINYNHDVSSMIMAVCWLVAVGALVFGFITTSKIAAPQALPK